MRLLGLLLIFGMGCQKPARVAGSCDGPCPTSKINHLIVVVQENHTFDNHFGRYCTAPTGSAPTCTTGPACCERGPDTDPSGAPPTALTDAEHAAYSPDHDQACELEELHAGQLDRFVTGASCSNPRNFAYADPSLVQPYWQLAGGGALADRWFQPVVGASASNDMYFARAGFVFKDNEFIPDAVGKECSFIPTARSFAEPTIADLLAQKGVSFAWYADGYAAMVAARKGGSCPEAPAACASGLTIYPCVYDPSDDPFDYYAGTRDNPLTLRDFGAFGKDLSTGKLPQVSFVKALGYQSEHPGSKVTLSDGVAFVSTLAQGIAASDYAPDTLLLVAYDEGGGYFDHVPPPPASTVDQQPLGSRVPLLALGPMARKNSVSHVQLEHSSIVKLIEWNWLGGQTGQLGTRDATVNNLGSLVDPALMVPEGQ